MKDIPKIYQTDPVLSDKYPGKGFNKRHKKKKQHRFAKDSFEALSRLVEETHRELENRDSPFRLCIYQDDEEIYIDVVTLDESGQISQVFKHDISHTEVENLVDQIKSGTGLILDADA